MARRSFNASGTSAKHGGVLIATATPIALTLTADPLLSIRLVLVGDEGTAKKRQAFKNQYGLVTYSIALYLLLPLIPPSLLTMSFPSMAAEKSHPLSSELKDDYQISDEAHDHAAGGIAKGGEYPTPAATHFQRKLGLTASIALGYVVISTWIASSATLSVVLQTGGTNCLVFGLLLCAVCNTASAASLSEAASLVTEGNQEVWAAFLSPKSISRTAAYLVGWITACGYILLGLAGETILAQLILAMAAVNNPDYVLLPVHVSAMCVAVTVFCTMFGIFGAKLLAKANTFNLVLNIVGLLAVSITLLAMTGDYKSSEQVFTEIVNVSGWSNDFIPWVAALGQAALSTTAYDSIAHFSPEMKSPQRSLPIAMVAGVGINGVVGFLYVIVLGYVVPSDLTALVESPTGFPFAQLLLDTTGSVAATIVLLMLLLLPFFCTVADVNMATARILLRFAERGGLPKVMTKANTKFDCPISTTILVCIIQIGLAWILCGSSAAFTSFVSAPALCLALSYSAVAALMLFYARPKLRNPPPFSLGKYLGPLCNLVTLVFSLCITVFLSLPAVYPVTADNMNYTSVIYVAVIVSGLILWYSHGKRSYSQPHVDSRCYDAFKY